MLLCIMDALEGQEFATVDRPGIFIHFYMENIGNM